MAESQIRLESDKIWHFSGDLSFQTVTSLLQEAARLQRDNVPEIADLSSVLRTDSAGLAFLLELMKMTQARGVTLQFRNLPQQLRNIAAISELTPLFEE
ncbi:MAG: STAS domain-containing protein [Pseudomonadota bacterium]